MKQKKKNIAETEKKRKILMKQKKKTLIKKRKRKVCFALMLFLLNRKPANTFLIN